MLGALIHCCSFSPAEATTKCVGAACNNVPKTNVSTTTGTGNELRKYYGTLVIFEWVTYLDGILSEPSYLNFRSKSSLASHIEHGIMETVKCVNQTVSTVRYVYYQLLI